MGDVPPSHPRYNSLMARKKLTAAASKGMLADSALIAHGRGEAFDYLLNEKTCNPARKAIREVAARLQDASSPVISLNGNTTVLAGTTLLACAAVLSCPIEINIYYRTPERMTALREYLESIREEAKALLPQSIANQVDDVPILGASPNGEIPGLEGPRAKCHSNGILGADVILVPLEDGDRCEALISMGKTVCVIDLNPLSRTAKMATVTIVDEVTRCSSLLLEDLLGDNLDSLPAWNQQQNLDDSLNIMLRGLSNGK
ncbi:MAG: phosphopantothenate/pantothenate synthetase [Candidatus Thalassarchaeaceae archaeon]|nr:phosphopantothenate/pantothenate synthetase [Candidatus Thalassarchaeaceae archaeon]